MSPASRLAVYGAILAVVFAAAHLLAGALVPAELVAEWGDTSHPSTTGA